MPIVFVHGVATSRKKFDETWPGIKRYLRHYAAPVIADDATKVAIVPAFWGDVGTDFRFGGINRPRSALLGMGGEDGESLSPTAAAAEFAKLLPSSASLSAGGRLVAAGPSGNRYAGIRVLTADQLSDLAVACAPDISSFEWLVDADEAAHDAVVLARIRQAPDDRAAVRAYIEAIEQRRAGDSRLTAMGAGRWTEWAQRMSEAMDRASGVGGFVASRLLGEVRKPVNDAALRFFGDVLVYLRARSEQDGSAGKIPQVVINALAEAADRTQDKHEPMVVVTHSMGGQIVYDLVTHFLPAISPTPSRIDFWCATASQVGLFLELNLFAAKDSGAAPLPHPSREVLGTWWNVWDYNDFLSFSANGIVAGVDDESYSSGQSLVTAHSGYLRRPSFFRRLRVKLTKSRDRGWDRPGVGTVS